MNLFEDTYEMTNDGIKIQNEFEALVKSFFQKYGSVTNPIELDWIVDQTIGIIKCSNYINQVTEQRFKN